MIPDDNLMNEFSEGILAKTAKHVNAISYSIDTDIQVAPDELSPELLDIMMETPTQLYIRDNGELTVTIDGDDFVIDPKTENADKLADEEKKIISSLPQLPWDVNCNGNKRKQKEASAAFKVIIINKIVGDLYTKAIGEIISNYDFANLRPYDNSTRSFLDMLSIIEQDAGSVIKFILSSISLMITSKKMKGEKPYTGTVPSSYGEFLLSMDEGIGIIEAEVSKELEREPSKVKRLQLIAEKDAKILAFVKEKIDGDPKRDILFKISRLTTDNLPAKTRILIKEEVRNNVASLMESKEINDDDFRNLLIKKVSRRALRQAVRTMQRIKYEQVFTPGIDLGEILPKT